MNNLSQKNQQKLSREDVDKLFADREQRLEAIRNNITRNFYYMLLEKIGSERQNLLELLKLQDQKLESLDKYSFVLDPQYFEQKFMPNLK